MEKIDLLHPVLRSKARLLINRAAEAGFRIIITQTLRTKEEQDALYAQGRTRPGPIVTQARYPQSLHCWGLAFDIAVIIDGRANWNVAYYDRIGPIGESLGLVWGGRWSGFPDRPHFQLPGYEWSRLETVYGTPSKFIATWKEEKPMPEIPPWKDQVMKEAAQAGIIMPNIHKPQEPADKAFVLAVILNLLRVLTKN
ncbi:MAG: M15 family metallopeptidase [Syntrophomonadaceae bacterium]|nr:M15 family metallopeptidase [Syntrophomonadaceae bacterium]